MHKRLYGLLEINNVLHSLQLGFRKKHSISHILIIMTEQIRNTIDMGVVFSLTSKKLLILLITPCFKKRWNTMEWEESHSNGSSHISLMENSMYQ